MITLLFYDNNLDLIDKGEFDVNRLDELLSNRIKNCEMYFDDYEVLISKTSFILSRTKADFLQVDVADRQTAVLFSQKICYSDTLFAKLQKRFGFKRFLYETEVDLPTAKVICQDYVVLDRQSFENKYQKFDGY